MIRRTLWMLCLALCLTLLIALTVLGIFLLPGWKPPPAGNRLTLQQVMEMSELVTLKLPLEQLVEVELIGYSGATRCVVLARGEALLAADLSSGEFKFNDAAKIVTVTLNKPHVLSASLDHEHTRTVMVIRTGLWQVVPGEAGESRVIERAMIKAQQQIHEAANDPRLLRQAMASTERILGDWFHRQGWTARFYWLQPTPESSH